MNFGRILAGEKEWLDRSFAEFEKIPVDEDFPDDAPAPVRATPQTIADKVSVSGPGTFLGKETRTITLCPTDKPGWRFQRVDMPDYLPVRVSAETVWTTGDIVSNIVLRSGPPHNYIRMVEHIIALRMGMPVDNLLIQIDSGDPPLFNRGSLDLVDAMRKAGTQEQQGSVGYVTVKEPVSIVLEDGRFLVIHPCDPAQPGLWLDCAINFRTAIGQQRIRFPVNEDHFGYGAEARTNTSFGKMLYCRTFGKIFADVRNLGYTNENVLVAGKDEYWNEARLARNGKSLEAVWHRAILDLLAALALIEEGRFLGYVTSYKAGHTLDVDLVRLLYQNDLLEQVAL